MQHDSHFAEIFNRWAPIVKASACVVLGSDSDSDDVVQNVFLRLLRKRDFLLEIDAPHALFAAAGRREAISVLRRRSRYVALDTVLVDDLASVNPDPLDKVALAELEMMLATAIGGLPKQCGKVLSEMLYMDASQQEMADRFGIKKSAVKKQIARGRGYLVHSAELGSWRER